MEFNRIWKLFFSYDKIKFEDKLIVFYTMLGSVVWYGIEIKGFWGRTLDNVPLKTFYSMHVLCITGLFSSVYYRDILNRAKVLFDLNFVT